LLRIEILSSPKEGEKRVRDIINENKTKINEKVIEREKKKVFIKE